MDENEQNEEILAYFKAMVSIERIRIAGLLAEEGGPIQPPAIAAQLSLPPVQVVHHLEQLQAARVVTAEAEGYRLDVKHIETLARRALAGRRSQTRPDAFEGDEFERKVLADFFTPEGRLKTIPAQEKKLRVVLGYLAGKFEPGTRYSEKQVNEMLKQVHPDSASLRRCLVDFRLVVRENGEYWRLPDPA